MLLNSENGVFTISRPMRIKEHKAKSIMVEVVEDKLLISDEVTDINTNDELFDLLESWID